MSRRLSFSQCSVEILWRALCVTLFACTLAGPGAAQAWGQWEQTHKVTADDAAAGDLFGRSVAISGGIAIVGAVLDDDACPEYPLCQSGSAYLFEVATGQQLRKLTAADAAMGDSFGSSVAISGGIAIVGAYWDDDACPEDPSCRSGSAYLFDVSDPENPVQLHKLTADDAAARDNFGSSVAISGGIAIVGAYHRDHDDEACPGEPDCNSGSAYLFDAATGQQLHKLTAEDAARWDHFGYSVSIDGGIAIVGARLDDDAGSRSGSAYLFDVTTGEQLHKLTAEDAAEGDRFGGSVSISGDIAIVGATGDDDAGPWSGSAYLFDVATGQQLHKLSAENAAELDLFGGSVAISGDIAIVGAVWDDDACPKDPLCQSGSVYLFNVTRGEQLHKLTAQDAAADSGFGFSVAISGGIAIVGAVYDDDMCPGHPHCNSGSAYVFELIDDCDDQDGDGRVTICHTPPGNPDNARTITVRANAISAHLAHGDYCGPCQE